MNHASPILCHLCNQMFTDPLFYNYHMQRLHAPQIAYHSQIRQAQQQFFNQLPATAPLPLRNPSAVLIHDNHRNPPPYRPFNVNQSSHYNRQECTNNCHDRIEVLQNKPQKYGATPRSPNHQHDVELQNNKVNKVQKKPISTNNSDRTSPLPQKSKLPHPRRPIRRSPFSPPSVEEKCIDDQSGYPNIGFRTLLIRKLSVMRTSIDKLTNRVRIDLKKGIGSAKKDANTLIGYFKSANPSKYLGFIYLIDSISRRVGDVFIDLFKPHIGFWMRSAYLGNKGKIRNVLKAWKEHKTFNEEILNQIHKSFDDTDRMSEYAVRIGARRKGKYSFGGGFGLPLNERMSYVDADNGNESARNNNRNRRNQGLPPIRSCLDVYGEDTVNRDANRKQKKKNNQKNQKKRNCALIQVSDNTAVQNKDNTALALMSQIQTAIAASDECLNGCRRFRKRLNASLPNSDAAAVSGRDSEPPRKRRKLDSKRIADQNQLNRNGETSGIQKNEDKNDLDNDVDLEVISAKKSTRCPLTLCIMSDPVKSSVCGHVFERKTVIAFISRSGMSAVDCPIPGCSRLITKQCFREDDETKRRIQEIKAKDKEDDGNKNIFDLSSDDEGDDNILDISTDEEKMQTNVAVQLGEVSSADSDIEILPNYP